MPAVALDVAQARAWLDDLFASLWSLLEPSDGSQKFDGM